ncbi:DUF805 domain-containing protein [Photobacterium sp. WH77]|uniref:DUF805 domain-containing protein n=1 Tax=unclassified Photobacterium TaxID=2628852 RepID=UPI001EDA0D42|nr:MULTISPECIES: DUF805 domain-containing protein [unclassified Photobacterium]MCG2838476.1 DUF805 domain-containing protein [Photobacterium sp. WH77]MCG2846152.1 DUF805 domain-containing protein [Photobacterium sp. WH80]MDO6580171.1 DUF805 domain-containing protein [Photobacterium sp. 2_MG-2023]
MNWYLYALRKYAVFSGRAQRQEYWYFFLINLVVTLALGIADNLLNTPGAGEGTGLLGGVYSLAVLIPSVAVGVRRLHDIGKSGWWMLLSLIPVLGFVILLFFFARAGQPGPNEYGNNPKEENGMGHMAM